jgi:hypothetical protein
MVLIDFRWRAAPGCGACSEPGQGINSSYGSGIAQHTTVPSGRPIKGHGWGLKAGRTEGVHNVHTLGFGSGSIGAGLDRIAEVFGGVTDSRGLEPGSSPTSGTVSPQVRGLFGVFRVDSVHTLASDLMFQVCGVLWRPMWLCGGAAAYGGPGTAVWGLLWVFILVRPSVAFSRSPLHGGWGRVQHDLLIIL